MEHSYDVFSYFDNNPLSSDANYYSLLQSYASSLKNNKENNLKKYIIDIKEKKYKSSFDFNLELLTNFGLDIPNINMDILPNFSFFIQFKFTLKKPFYSKDDEQLYIIDNPVSKEFVFKIPMCRGSGWKGALKHAISKIEKNENEIQSTKRLFGCASDAIYEEDNSCTLIGKKGSINIFPTYFNDIDLEVINPHDRNKKAGTNPILYEVVPPKTVGTFSLLYVPQFREKEDSEKYKNIIDDLCLLSHGLKSMFLDQGFGAKTSSGYGIIENKLTDGSIILKLKSIKENVNHEEKIPEDYEKYKKYFEDDGELKEIFEGTSEGGLLSNKEFSERKSEIQHICSLNDFKKFRVWYNNNSHLLINESKTEPKSIIKWPFWNFKDFDELNTLIYNQIKPTFIGED